MEQDSITFAEISISLVVFDRDGKEVSYGQREKSVIKNIDHDYLNVVSVVFTNMEENPHSSLC